MYKIGILFLDTEFEHDVYELIKAFYPEAEIHTAYEREDGEYDLRFRVERDEDSCLIRYECEEHMGVTRASIIKGYSRKEKVIPASRQRISQARFFLMRTATKKKERFVRIIKMPSKWHCTRFS